MSESRTYRSKRHSSSFVDFSFESEFINERLECAFLPRLFSPRRAGYYHTRAPPAIQEEAKRKRVNGPEESESSAKCSRVRESEEEREGGEI